MSGLGKINPTILLNLSMLPCHTCFMVHAGPSRLHPLYHVPGWKLYNDCPLEPKPSKELPTTIWCLCPISLIFLIHGERLLNSGDAMEQANVE